MAGKELIHSAASRMFRLGGLAGRVGISMAGNTMANLFRDTESRDEHRAIILMKNAVRVKELLGQLKGVPMKIGQMISLHEQLLPEEVVRVLKTLQQNAPAVPFEELHKMVKQELGQGYAYIKHIDETPLAAASIGQVHRAVLVNGVEIALKIQYPGIDDVIRADLKNLKGLLKLLFSMFSRMDMEPVWQELKDRLMEELDYEKEAVSMKRMADLFADDKRIIVPKVIEEVTTRHILGMELVLGISPDKVSENRYPQSLKNTWAESMVNLILKGLFQFRFLHADPNIANFAFLEDGRLIVYDFGCMKKVPEKLCHGYIHLISVFLNHEYPEIPIVLKSMGVHKANGDLIPWQMAADFADVFQDFFEPDTQYTFGDDKKIYARLYELGNKHISESMSMVFPKDIIFIDRTFGGHFGNLCRLNAQADWRSLLLAHISHDETE
ncbi:MAG: AarF/ABC1/UbiB kinase family protein [Desulfobacteraceae bacterium]|jgi:predicted unusual protein kinase regulating ubiquinone biosynthesis (AarF/ABC1/UbiB family)|nr:AarF/ABC1/UbiB kinase family protein [Desulfobacteraceae bacterium]